jgi:REP element-mobilizing transposase RayT
VALRLAEVTRSHRWSCVAYCLMKTHYHLIVRVDDGVLPRAMHRLNLAYARHHNLRHRLRGHVQFARYGARRLHDKEELRMAFAYVANNPVKAGLCSAPAAWPWSSYAGTVGARRLSSCVDPLELVRAFDGHGFDPRAALRAFVEAP